MNILSRGMESGERRAGHARIACGSNHKGGRKQEPTEATQGWLHATPERRRNLRPSGQRGCQIAPAINPKKPNDVVIDRIRISQEMRAGSISQTKVAMA